MISKDIKEKVTKYFSLLMQFAKKDLKVRYKSTFLGFFWALLVPISTMLVFKLVFSFFLRIKIPNVPYSIYLLTGLFPWFFFSTSIFIATTSLVDNGNLLKKVYFDRTIIPTSIIVSNLFNFLLSFVILIIYMAILQMKISISILSLPVVIILQIILTLGIALLFSSLYINFRDIRYGVEILFMIWFYLTPIFYPVDLIKKLPTIGQKLFMLNPMANIIIMYRDILIYCRFPDSLMLYKTIFSCIFIYITGLIIFKRFEPKFVDLI